MKLYWTTRNTMIMPFNIFLFAISVCLLSIAHVSCVQEEMLATGEHDGAPVLSRVPTYTLGVVLPLTQMQQDKLRRLVEGYYLALGSLGDKCAEWPRAFRSPTTYELTTMRQPVFAVEATLAQMEKFYHDVLLELEQHAVSAEDRERVTKARACVQQRLAQMRTQVAFDVQGRLGGVGR